MYYLRSRPAVDAVQFTVDKAALKTANSNDENRPEETKASRYVAEDDGEGCLMCSG